MICCVLFKPYVKIKNINVGLYWIVCLIGAIALVVFRAIPLSSVILGITENTAVNPLKILTLFISMTLISIFLGDAGFFDYVAQKVFLKSNGSKVKLLIVLYMVVAVLTVFTSNDIIILTFTPPICIFAKKAKVSPFPFLFAEFISANTWSMTLIVGNPTNIYLATSFGIGFFEYFTVMWLPAIVCGLTGLLILLLAFKKDLSGNLTKTNVHINEPITVKKLNMIMALTVLVVTIVLLAISDFISLPMWLVCLIGFGVLTVFNVIVELIRDKKISSTLKVLSKAPFELIPFVLSMFVIVLSLNENGVTDILTNAFVTGEKTDGVIFALLSGISANLLNNIPMSVLFSKIAITKTTVFGAIIGSNIGAFVTPVGALAGIMWSKILRNYDVKLPFSKFCLYGGAVAIPSLVLSSFSLLI